MKSLILAILLISTFATSGSAQSDTLRSENTHKKQFFIHQIIPLGLITTGALLNMGQIKETIHDHTPHTNTKVILLNGRLEIV